MAAAIVSLVQPLGVNRDADPRAGSNRSSGLAMTFDLILIALAVSLYPLPLTAFILVLSAPGGTRTGAGFLTGWLANPKIAVSGQR